MACSITNKPVSFEKESEDYLVFSPAVASSVDCKISFIAQEAFEKFGRQQSGTFSYLVIKALSEEERTFLQSNADKLNSVEMLSNELFKKILSKVETCFLREISSNIPGVQLTALRPVTAISNSGYEDPFLKETLSCAGYTGL